jgi:hypothetical protein
MGREKSDGSADASGAGHVLLSPFQKKRQGNRIEHSAAYMHKTVR